MKNYMTDHIINALLSSVTLYKQYKFVQNFSFDIYTQKLIEKMHMCNADDAKWNFTT